MGQGNSTRSSDNQTALNNHRSNALTNSQISHNINNLFKSSHTTKIDSAINMERSARQMSTSQVEVDTIIEMKGGGNYSKVSILPKRRRYKADYKDSNFLAANRQATQLESEDISYLRNIIYQGQSGGNGEDLKNIFATGDNNDTETDLAATPVGLTEADNNNRSIFSNNGVDNNGMDNNGMDNNGMDNNGMDNNSMNNNMNNDNDHFSATSNGNMYSATSRGTATTADSTNMTQRDEDFDNMFVVPPQSSQMQTNNGEITPNTQLPSIVPQPPTVSQQITPQTPPTLPIIVQQSSDQQSSDQQQKDLLALLGDNQSGGNTIEHDINEIRSVINSAAKQRGGVPTTLNTHDVSSDDGLKEIRANLAKHGVPLNDSMTANTSVTASSLLNTRAVQSPPTTQGAAQSTPITQGGSNIPSGSIRGGNIDDALLDFKNNILNNKNNSPGNIYSITTPNPINLANSMKGGKGKDKDAVEEDEGDEDEDDDEDEEDDEGEDEEDEDEEEDDNTEETGQNGGNAFVTHGDDSSSSSSSNSNSSSSSTSSSDSTSEFSSTGINAMHEAINKSADRKKNISKYLQNNYTVTSNSERDYKMNSRPIYSSQSSDPHIGSEYLNSLRNRDRSV
jgi:hypothetical protein